jgi:hypothetical protein
VQHLTTRDAEHVGGDLPELDIGRLDQLLDAVGDRRMFFDQCLAVARQLSQLADLQGWDEAGLQQAVA